MREHANSARLGFLHPAAPLVLLSLQGFNLTLITFSSHIQLISVAVWALDQIKKSCFEAGLSALLCVWPPKKDHHRVRTPSQSWALCTETRVGFCLSAKSPAGGSGSIKNLQTSAEWGVVCRGAQNISMTNRKIVNHTINAQNQASVSDELIINKSADTTLQTISQT